MEDFDDKSCHGPQRVKKIREKIILLSLRTFTQKSEPSLDQEGETSTDSLPPWLARPGASEAVVVGADIRGRYASLKVEVETKSDEVKF